MVWRLFHRPSDSGGITQWGYYENDKCRFRVRDVRMHCDGLFDRVRFFHDAWYWIADPINGRRWRNVPRSWECERPSAPCRVN
jgi:hypothetical protein